jgi:hypothetical protein
MSRIQSRAFRGRSLALCGALALLCGPALAQAPQHWGFGQGYLAALETREDGTRDLVVFEAPLRAKDAEWLVRWRSPGIAKTQGGAWIACGEFRRDAGAQVAVATSDASGLEVTVFEPPQVFSARPWKALPAKSRLVPIEKLVAKPLFVAAGRVRGGAGDPDALLVLSRAGTSGDGGLQVVWIAPATAADGEPAIVGREGLPGEIDPEKVLGFAAGDFWGTGEDALCVVEEVSDVSLLHFIRWGAEMSPRAAFVRVVDDACAEVPKIAPGGIAAGDFVRDGFDALALAPADPAKPWQIRVAPSREPSKPPDPGPLSNGRSLARQPLPGSGRDSSALSMTARPQGMEKRREGPLALAAGALFGRVAGEVNAGVRKEGPPPGAPDAEIAYVHRANFPGAAGSAPGFGWPARGEETTWQIVLRNNGDRQVPGGAVLRVWLCADRPNADVTGAKPDAEFRAEALSAFDGKADVFVQTVKAPWPYELESCPGDKRKRLNLRGGERWLIATLEAEGDANERNNRLEVAWNALALRFVARRENTGADRTPDVPGDPASLDYLARKLADALSCAWARGGAADNADAPVRVFFSGWDVGWPDDLPEKDRDARWKALRDAFDGVLPVERWFGGDWERFGWKDGTETLATAAALFHPVGDLKSERVSPVRSGLATKGDRTPASFSGYCWGPDILANGHAVVGLPACEWAARFSAGTRGAPFPVWREMSPDKVLIRVLDRNGAPVPAAGVSVFVAGKSSPLRSGTTGADATFDTGHSAGNPGSDPFGRKRTTSGLCADNGVVVCVSVLSHHEAFLLGSEDLSAHGRLALFQHSMTDAAAWTCDVRLNWAKDALAPDFALDASVQGFMAELRAKGEGKRTYRVYRRWEPSYRRTLVNEYPTGDGALTIPFDLAGADAWGKDRERAIVEVTSVDEAGAESLPRIVHLFALHNALGLSAWTEDRLVVANNNGTSDPYGATFGFTSPEREMLYFPEPRHVARKVVRSGAKPSRAFVTLKSCGGAPARCLEVLDCPQGGLHATNYDLGQVNAKRASVKEFRVQDPRQLGELNLGDECECDGKAARVSAIRLECVTVEKAIFDLNEDRVQVKLRRSPGLEGGSAPMRELSSPRGMCLLVVNGREFLAIADTGNSRVVVWDETTKYVAGYGGEKFRPVALATDPRDPRVFFVLDRRPDRKSHIVRLTFNGRGIERDHSWNVDVGDWQGEEQGLAIMAMGDELNRVRLAVTDAEQARVLFFIVSPDRLGADGVITEVKGAHAGPGELEAPIDCVLVPAEKRARLFVLDGRERVVEAEGR